MVKENRFYGNEWLLRIHELSRFKSEIGCAEFGYENKFCIRNKNIYKVYVNKIKMEVEG